MKVGVLTSSRADYGIYRPLLFALGQDPEFELQILAFGTHLSKTHGYTVSEIEEDGFIIKERIPFLTKGDTPKNVSDSIAENTMVFSQIWARSNYDVVFALGDRYEMFAAVTAASPFAICVAHIHGGETTLGAMDNAFRHAISHMSQLHFTCAEQYQMRVKELLGHDREVYNVGALSIDALSKESLMSKEQFLATFGINLDRPTILVTFHPETVEYTKNEGFVKELCSALSELYQYQQVITMPNADTSGLLVRKVLEEYVASHENVVKVESFGAVGYRTCMKHCAFMVGNSSSGFVEASFFKTPVINIGTRQTGRIRTANILDVGITKHAILDSVKRIGNIPSSVHNPYGNGTAAEQIIKVLKTRNAD